MGYGIVRTLFFCYGHRLVGHPGACARLHGHNARVDVELAASELDALGRVVDFQDVRDRLGRWIDAHLDHRMILQQDDPILSVLRAHDEDVVAVPFPPTAENLARMLFERARELDLPVTRIVLYETPHARAVYAS